MKQRIISVLVISSLIFAFLIFYKGLNKSNLYQPKSEIRNVPEFKAITFFEKEEINSESIFDKNKYYLFNIWASWCVPCKEEHPFLVDLNKKKNLEIVGLNYKDNKKNAKIFLDDLGNPYDIILMDQDGTISIEWGAYGVPETFLIYNKKIIKKIIGPLDLKKVFEINELVK